MYLRKVQRFKCIIPFGYIADRWLLNSPSMISQFRTKEVDVTGYSEGEFTVINRSRPKSQTDKYKEAMVSAKRFAEILSTRSIIYNMSHSMNHNMNHNNHNMNHNNHNMSHNMDHNMIHNMDHNMDHNMIHNMDHNMNHNMNHNMSNTS
ncbi:hypothetical protein PRIC2_001706 [Phytophthora ramorum]